MDASGTFSKLEIVQNKNLSVFLFHRTEFALDHVL